LVSWVSVLGHSLQSAVDPSVLPAAAASAAKKFELRSVLWIPGHT